MDDSFDPYFEWLGIPKEEQPPDLYRLLGLRPFEEAASLIQSAVAERTVMLKRYELSKHSAECQTLLNEISAASVCLLDQQKKAAYDMKLRVEMLRVEDGSPQSRAKLGNKMPGRRSWLPVGHFLRLIRPSSRNELAMRVGLVLISLAIIVLFAGFIVQLSNPTPKDAVLAFDWPSSERQDGTLRVNGESVSVPPSGPCEHRGTPGRYNVVAKRPGYVPFEQSVDVEPGTTVTIRPVWEVSVGTPLAEPSKSLHDTSEAQAGSAAGGSDTATVVPPSQSEIPGPRLPNPKVPGDSPPPATAFSPTAPTHPPQLATDSPPQPESDSTEDLETSAPGESEHRGAAPPSAIQPGADPPMTGGTIAVDLTKRAPFVVLSSLSKTHEAQIQVTNVTGLDTEYRLEPSHGMLTLGKTVDIVFAEYPDVKIQLTFCTRAGDLGLRLEATVDRGQSGTMAFTQKLFEREWADLRRQERDIKQQLDDAGNEAAQISSWLAAPGTKPAAKAGQMSSRLIFLQNRIFQLQASAARCQVRAEVLQRYSDFAQQVHDNMGIQYSVEAKPEKP